MLSHASFRGEFDNRLKLCEFGARFGMHRTPCVDRVAVDAVDPRMRTESHKARGATAHKNGRSETMNIKTVAVAFGAIIGLSAPAAAQTYTIGANPQGSIFYAAAATIAKVAVEKTGLQFRVAPYSGSSTYIPLVDKGELAFGMSNAAEYAFSYAGKELFEGHPSKNLRSVLVTFGLRNGFGVRNDSPMKTVADLKGKTIPVGYSSGRIFDYLQRASLAAAGLSVKDVKGVPMSNFVVGDKAFMSGRVDAAYFPFNSGIGKQAMAKLPGGWRYLSIGDAPDTSAKASTVLPTSRTVKVKPGKNATGVAMDPTVLLEVDVAMFANKDVPDDVVYRLVKTVFQNKPALAKSLVGFSHFNPQHMARVNPVPYHPGAIKAYKELGLWPPK
jgi:TRAP transporter TAXI family solute receptor